MARIVWTFGDVDFGKNAREVLSMNEWSGFLDGQAWHASSF